jgi:hypothetical protein
MRGVIRLKPMIRFFPNGLLPKKIIKIPGKSFEDLSLLEIALMIEADSSLAEDGNDYFASCALDEFLHCSKLEGRADLQQIRDEILNNIYLDIPDSKSKKINTEFLVQYANDLRSKTESAL